MLARRLRLYFQAYTVVVLTDQPLRKVLQKHDMSERLVRWAMALSEFDIQYKPRPAIKSQVLADFIAECTIPSKEASISLDATIKDGSILSYRPWILHVDGSSTPSASGTGIILTRLMGETIEYALHFTFSASNNEAEYEALLTSLKLAEGLGVSELRVFSDS